MRLLSRSILPVATALLLAASASAASAQTSRARIAAIDDADRVTLPNSRSPHAVAAFDKGQVEPSLQLHGIELDFAMSAAQQADLSSLLAAQQDPTSAQYHQWLTPAQFAARFGMSDADLATAQSWLQSKGFTVDSVSPNRLAIYFSGTAAQVRSSLGADLHYYQGTTDATAHFASATDINLPAGLSGVVSGVHHLSSFRLQPHLLSRGPVSVHPNFTSGQTGNHFLTPPDVATLYDVTPVYNAGYNGAGQTIVVIGQSAVLTSDITNFQTAIGQTAKAPTLTLMPGTGTSQLYTSDESESDLDLEYSSGMAPGATVNFVYTGNSPNYGVFDALKYAIQNNLGQVITISYGECEVVAGTPGSTTAGDFGSMEPYFQQAAAQGETVINSSGDAGSTSCAAQSGVSLVNQQSLSASYPSSSAYVVSIGGTEFSSANSSSSNSTYWSAASGSTDKLSSLLSYVPEQVWNDDTASTSLGASLSSGGGGVSTLAARPSWQTGVSGIPTGFFRLLPDISLAASPSYPGYLYCSSDSQATGITGSCSHGLRDTNNTYLTVGGGTSFGAPIFAGLVAVLNSAKGATKGQGLITPTLYTLAASASTYASVFHDITSGGNQCTVGITLCGSGNANLWYTATTGYDEASGLGSIDFNNLVNAWSSAVGSTSTKSFTLAASPTSLTVTAGASGTATVTVTPAGGYTGTVAWSIASSPLLNYACYTLANATITGTTAATSTLSIATTNSSCQAGAAFKTTVGASQAGTSNSASLRSPATPASHGKLPAELALAGLLLTGFAGRRASRLRGLTSVATVGLLGLLGVSLSGCSSGTSSGSSTSTTTTTTTTVSQTVSTAPKGTYTLTITGTDTINPKITASTTLTLIIQ